MTLVTSVGGMDVDRELRPVARLEVLVAVRVDVLVVDRLIGRRRGVGEHGELVRDWVSLRLDRVARPGLHAPEEHSALGGRLVRLDRVAVLVDEVDHLPGLETGGVDLLDASVCLVGEVGTGAGGRGEAERRAERAHRRN